LGNISFIRDVSPCLQEQEESTRLVELSNGGGSLLLKVITPILMDLSPAQEESIMLGELLSREAELFKLISPLSET